MYLVLFLKSGATVPSTMNPPTEISPSTQLLLDEIRKIFHKYEAKWDQRLTKHDAAREASPGVLVLSPSAADGV